MHSEVRHFGTLRCRIYFWLLVSCLRGELPLSAEAVRKFGPMHVPSATKGYENLFVAVANCKRVDGSTLCSSEGCIRCAPQMEYLNFSLLVNAVQKLLKLVNIAKKNCRITFAATFLLTTLSNE